MDLEPRTNLHLKKQVAQMQDFLQDVGVIATASGILRRFTRASGPPAQVIESYYPVYARVLRLQQKPIVNERTGLYSESGFRACCFAFFLVRLQAEQLTTYCKQKPTHSIIWDWKWFRHSNTENFYHFPSHNMGQRNAKLISQGQTLHTILN